MGFLFGGDTGETADSLARQHLNDAMMRTGKPIESRTQGFAELARAMMAGLDTYHDHVLAQNAVAAARAARSGLPYTPPEDPGIFAPIANIFHGFGGNPDAAQAPAQAAAVSVAPPDVSGFETANPYAFAAISREGRAGSQGGRG
jgi:hypothetical protein